MRTTLRLDRSGAGFFGALFLTALLAAACGDDDNVNDAPDAGNDVIPTYSVTGSVVDFATGEPVPGDATVSVEGVLYPVPTVQVTGADFVIDGVLPSSVVTILSSSPPDYRGTYNPAVEVATANVTGVTAKVVSETYLTGLADGFGVTPAAGTGILLAKVVDETGAVREGLGAQYFQVNGQAPAYGPYFLDADKQPAPALNATSASGYVVFFGIPAGTVTVSAPVDSGYTLTMPVSPAGADAVTLAYITALAGDAPPPPVDVSFLNDVIPIFERRTCFYCHGGGGAGKQDGGLSLQGSPNLIYSELVEEISPDYGVVRVNVDYPAQSILLTLPGPEIDNHPNTTFASPADPDYQLLLGWIAQGAQNN